MRDMTEIYPNTPLWTGLPGPLHLVFLLVVCTEVISLDTMNIVKPKFRELPGPTSITRTLQFENTVVCITEKNSQKRDGRLECPGSCESGSKMMLAHADWLS
jgi:hypothetical protein